jgi:hypothetical protein
VNNKHKLENSGAFSPTNSPAILLDADLTVQREAPGGLAEAIRGAQEIRKPDTSAPKVIPLPPTDHPRTMPARTAPPPKDPPTIGK